MARGSYGWVAPWDTYSAPSEAKEYFAQTLTWLHQDSPIPPKIWRLFVGYVARSFVTEKKLTDKQVHSLVHSALMRSGVAAISPVTLPVDYVYNGVPFVGVRLMGENRFVGLTPRQIQQNTGVLFTVALEAVGPGLEAMLDDLDVEAKMIFLATPESVLPAKTWYWGAFTWKSTVPSTEDLRSDLEKAGMSLFPDMVGPYGSTGKMFPFNTGDEPRKVSDVVETVGAESVVINLTGGRESWSMDFASKMIQQGKDVGKAAGDFGEGFLDAIEQFLKTGGTILTVAKYALLAAVPLALAYGGWRGWKWWQKERKKR
jgi:hypothetical protein